jgi:hypothetical protein
MSMEIPDLIPPYCHEPGAVAAHALFKACREVDTYNRPIAEFLVNLHDVGLPRPDARQLCRWTDPETFENVLVVMRWFRGWHGPSNKLPRLVDMFGSDGERVMSELMTRFGISSIRWF